jgi:16S rRNA processing protein RimM
MDVKECFNIGYVAKSHGLKGEITIVMSPECPDLQGVKTIFVQTRHDLVPYFIESLSVKGNKAFLKLEDVNTPELAASLKGSTLFLPKSVRPKLSRGEFYNDEIIGFDVMDKETGLLGPLKDVLESGYNRFLLVDRNGKEIMIPVNGPFIKGINKSGKKITVSLPEGFLDL